MDERLAAAWRVLPERLAAHVALSGAAILLAAAISLPLALLAVRRPRLRWALLSLAGLIQTVPGLALVALFYPLLLLVSQGLHSLHLPGVPALGFLPAVLALTLYGLLPMLRNAVAGLAGVAPALREAADGIGMTPRQKLLWVEAPLAAPVVMAGVRTSAVLVIGTAVLATTVGQPSLGDYIFSGLQTEDWVAVLFGCAAAAGLAIAVDQLLGLLEAAAARRDPRRAALGGAGLALLALLSLAPGAVRALAPRTPGYVIGAKNFSEQFILADLMAARLRATGARVDERTGLGSAVIFRALVANDLDAYVDYSGTLWTNVLGRRDTPPRAQLLAQLRKELKRRYGVELLGPLGFENAYALTMRADRARALGVRTLEDLAPRTPQLVLGADLEFLQRPEWRALRDAYGLRFKAAHAYTPTFMYRALDDGEADVITAFSSDGRLAGGRLLALADPRGAAPSYDAVLLVAPRRVADARLHAALSPLLGAIDAAHMRAANAQVDLGGRTPAQAATALSTGLSRGGAPPRAVR
ncbi:MAG: ABC transporter permease/substrate-binding protein [Caulobacteraceae bacterium]|nr:ABC transporter permease/substrate-binding protein [Caulobacter sp.]